MRFLKAQTGSSPLARGTRCEDQVGVGGLGLIPARAGNTATGWCGRECRRAHPRSRGEHSKFLASSVMLRGSSPLARGTRAEEEAGTFSRGLIPARAGNTCCQCGWVVFLGAHPRSRGEHVILLRSAVSLGWLIPARAGNTALHPAGCTVPRAHPRSRGEHGTVTGSLRLNPGSSPLARGTLSPASTAFSRVGLIPARAGNTAAVRRSLSLAWAHPRSRGEHGERVPAPAPAWGSSPLARGTRIMHKGGTSKSGLIPARAGNT